MYFIVNKKVLCTKGQILHLYGASRTGKFMQTESRLEVTRGWGWENGELLLDGYGVSV
jgi:hypothetical protein